MRFRKGSKVEVLSKREVPSGSWFVAEIISGNGRYYNVKYDGDHAMEKVQRKAIRPPPPLISRSRDWAPGDIVEVFENNSWKTAMIMQVFDGGNYNCLMLGRPSKELRVKRSSIRMRQSWKGNRWVLIDEASGKSKEGNMKISPDSGKFDNRKLQRCTEVKKHEGHNQFRTTNNKYDYEHCQISLRGLRKRSDFCLPTLEENGRALGGRKMGAVNKEGKRQRLLVAHSSELPDKGQSWGPAKHASVGPRY